jgi:hypothetical protein
MPRLLQSPRICPSNYIWLASVLCCCYDAAPVSPTAPRQARTTCPRDQSFVSFSMYNHLNIINGRCTVPHHWRAQPVWRHQRQEYASPHGQQMKHSTHRCKAGCLCTEFQALSVTRFSAISNVGHLRRVSLSPGLILNGHCTPCAAVPTGRLNLWTGTSCTLRGPLSYRNTELARTQVQFFTPVLYLFLE